MTAKPLRGKTIAITRPKDQGDGLARKLRAAGARVVLTPAIRIRPLSSKKLDEALKNLGAYDSAVFTSANAVDCFFNRARRLRLGPPRRPQSLYAVGRQTVAALAARGWPGARAPKNHHGEALAALMGSVRGRKILFPRAKTAREALPRILREKGAKLSVIACYETLPDRAGLRRLLRISPEKIHAITFTSESTVHRLMARLKPAKRRALFAAAAAASIGPITSSALEKYGVGPIVQAKKSTSSGLYDALLAHFKKREAPR